MSKFKYSNGEQQINNVLNYQAQEFKSIQRPDMSGVDKRISESEELLKSLGYSLTDIPKIIPLSEGRKHIVPTWEEMCTEAEKSVGNSTDLETLFTKEELRANEQAIKLLNEEFNAVHRLDKFDITISAAAGILGAAVDILLVGIPQKTPDGLKAGALSNYIREWFDKKFPEEEMEKLANSRISKVPYDAQDNRNTTEFVNGLSAYYHRLLSLGHDPLLGLIFGVFDIMTGRMTTIDKTGKIVTQVMENYADRKESNIFAAIAKQIIHFKSDITTSMGLPVPLMGLFNLLQFGNIGEEEQTIAEIVQGMYYEGYDFIHFCSMSIPTMIIEVVIRIGYAFKRIKEGYPVKESIPFSLNREKHPKLSTMLFIGHSAITAINAGKILFTKNPMAINYTQWILFAKYSYKQLKWALLKKPELIDAYVRGTVFKELSVICEEVDTTFREYAEKYIVVFK
ncbi:hypothetical protein QPM05_16385 [Caldibacillus thermoamylovorans]|nr:hypothetical protein [Caldibacillus thermoamylovorans]